MLNICEVFESIQGESTFSGLPFYFIRLAGCNLRCSYCDTSYAWKEGNPFDTDQLCRLAVDSGRRHVLVTGGEPLLQPETPVLLKMLLERNLTVLLETNGSIAIDKVPPQVIRIMDIKTPASGESHRMCWANLEVMQAHDQIKFVVAHRTDLPWIEDVIRRYDLDQRVSVLISPNEQAISRREISSWILNCGLMVRLQLQLHKLIWGSERRGV